MKQNQAQRLTRVLLQDKSASPQRLLPSLKSDLRDILKEYGELDGDSNLEIEETPDGFNIIFLAKVIRFKSYGNIV